MSESQFAFLESEFPDEFAAVVRAEGYALTDPGTSVIHARRALESGVKWAFAHDRSLPQPWEDQLNAYLNEPGFKSLANGRIFNLAKKIQRAGNRAVHEAKPPSKLEAVEIVSALFQFSFWLAHTYGRESKPDPSIKFNPHKLSEALQQERASLEQRRELQERLDREAAEAEQVRVELAAASQTIEQLEAERVALLAQVAEAKQAAAAVPVEEHDWSEAETRLYKIDKLLAEAGWPLADARDREFEVSGMPSGSGVGFVDYVLWGDDGLPLALIEAKKTTASPMAGQEQARLYADCLEAQFGRRPVVFYSNGYEHWLWDDAQYPPRKVQGFLTNDELELMLQRRETRRQLAGLGIDDVIVERFYQHRAIRAIGEHFEVDMQRKALVVMATGAGKTRTVIALVDLLMRANWVKRVLFLADRTALVNEAVNAFKQHLPDSSPVNLVTDPNETGHVYVSTYQTMVGKIDEYRNDGTRRFGSGHFDLVVIDEAHRSVYRKYRGIFDYFDSLLVGLTATPKDEVTKNTYDLFDLETGVPTDAYGLDDAINDGYLVPPRSVSVPLKFVREGIRYDDLTDDEKDDWDEQDWGDDEDGNPLGPPDEVSAAEVNKYLFNEDTIDKVLEHLMTEGIRVAGGDRLGKSIIFAKNQKHAEFIYERFIANYPALDNGNFARIITHSTTYAQSLIDDFSIKDKAPHIAISVDMLDTGIDVPEVVNLVFFKLVRSRTKFWQMLGRGTRLCPDLFGPGDDKRRFNVFDFCQNLEFFSQPMLPAEGGDATPLSEQLFTARLELLQQLDAGTGLDDERDEVAGILHETVASMNPDNFIVRPHLALVEKFGDAAAWSNVSIGDLAALANNIAKLPAQLEPEPEESKRFDVLVLNAELALLRGEPFEPIRKRIVKIAGLLEDQQSIPVVAAHLALIQDVQSDEWWVDVTYPMLEEVRKKLRALVPLIERAKKGIVYTDIDDIMGVGVEIELPGTGYGGGPFELVQFEKKARKFLRENLGEWPVVRVRSGVPLNESDFDDLQRLLVAAGIGDTDTFEQASQRAGNFGLFIRQLVGLDRTAAKGAFNDFLDDKRYSADQIRFVNLIIDYLTEHGALEAGRIYDSPFTDIAPAGPDVMFVADDLDRIFDTVAHLTNTASPE